MSLLVLGLTLLLALLLLLLLPPPPLWYNSSGVRLLQEAASLMFMVLYPERGMRLQVLVNKYILRIVYTCKIFC